MNLNFAKSMNMNLVFAKAINLNLNLNVLIKHTMNLIFSNQNLHCESSDLLTGRKDSESDQNTTTYSKLFRVLLLCLFFVYFLIFFDKNYEFVQEILS